MKRIIRFLYVVLVLTFNLQLSTFNCFSAEKGLVAHWSFDREGDTVKDDSGNGNEGAATNCEFVKGIAGKAIKLSGQGSFVEVQHSESIMPEKFTISAWINPSTYDAEDRGPIIVSKYGGPAYNGYLLLLDGKSGKPSLHTGDNQDMKGDRYKAVAMKAVSLNEWHFIAGTYDGAKLRIYVDGALKGSADGVFDVDENGSLVIGAQSWNKELGLFTGLIDEIKIYNRVLTDKEIQDQYSAVGGGAAKPAAEDSSKVKAQSAKVKTDEAVKPVTSNEKPVTKETDLLGYWSFDEGTGDAVKDSSGNGNEGALVNGPVWIKGVSGNALSFEGKDDLVEIPQSDSIDVGAEGSSYTVEFWFKATTKPVNPPDAHFLIKDKFPYPFTVTQFSDGRLDFRTYDNNICPSVGTKTNFSDGKWHYIVCVRDGKKKKLMIYGDALLEAFARDATEGDIKNDGPLKIGRSMGDDFNGAVDEVKLYGRALSEDEISQHFTALGGKVPEKRSAVSPATARKAEGVLVTRKKMMDWKPVVDGQGSAVKEGDSVKLKNNWMEVAVSAKTGEITSLTLKGKNMLERPAGFVVRDILEGNDFGTSDGAVSGVQVSGDGKSAAVVSFKKDYAGFSAVVTYTMDKQALCLDVKLSTERSGREVNIDFIFPALSQIDSVFWGADNAPFKYPKLPLTRFIYRQGVVILSATVYSQAQDIGLTFVGPFDLPKPGLAFSFAKQVTVSNFYLYVNKGEPTRAAVYVVPHEGDWRPGMAWMLKAYPNYFNPVSKRTFNAEGWYYLSGPAESESKMKNLNKQLVTWHELHSHFPFYGIYMPDTDTWSAFVGEADAGKGDLAKWEQGTPQGGYQNSYDKMRKLIDGWHKYGINTHLYFQSFELWIPYADKYFADDIARDESGSPHGAWYFCRLMNPDPAYAWGKHIAEQIKRVTLTYPKIDGIFYDRDDYWNYDFSHEDGVTAQQDRQCYMLGFAQEQINKVIEDTLHPLDMGIWTNGPTSIEVCRDIDGIMSEANSQSPYMQYAGLARPLILLPYDNKPEQTEDKLKLALAYSHFASVTYGGAKNRKIEDKYKAVFAPLKNKKWVLTAHALTLPEGARGNIYQSPNGDYLVAVVNMGRSQLTNRSFSHNVPVRIKVSDAKDIKNCYLVSGDFKGVNKIDFKVTGDIIDVNIPMHLVSSLVVLSKAQRYNVSRNSLPLFTRGAKNQISINVTNPSDRKFNGIYTISLPWADNTGPLALDPMGSKVITASFTVPADLEVGEVEFGVTAGETEEKMSAWIMDAVQLDAGGSIFISSQSGQDVQVRAINNTDREITVGLKAEMDEGKAALKIPSSLSLKPYEEKTVVLGVIPETEKGRIRVVSTYEGASVKTLFPFEGAMISSKNDLFSDNFKTGDMSKWEVKKGDWEVAGGAAKASGLSSLAVTGDQSWKDYVFQVTTKLEGSESPNIGWLKSYIFFRMQDENNFYRFGIHGDGNTVDLYKCENNNWVPLGTFAIAPEKGRWYTFKIEVSGKNIKGYVDGKVAIKAKDESFLSGGIGMGVLEDNMVIYYKDVIVRKMEE